MNEILKKYLIILKYSELLIKRLFSLFGAIFLYKFAVFRRSNLLIIIFNIYDII